MGKFDRNISLLGEKKSELIQSKHVLIAGIGGVGGYAAEAIARLGVKEITLIDYDCIEETNINRQIIATNINIGNLKTEEFKKRILSINSECNVHIYNCFIDDTNINKLISKVDYVIDAIDSLESKILLYKYCILNCIKFVSCMGMANKIDPTKISVTTLDKTYNDKLAKRVREMCKKEAIPLNEVEVVFSDEQAYANFKNDIPSIIMPPAAAGLACAFCFIKSI